MIQEKGYVTMPRALKDFWKGYVDFKGTTTRAGYWFAYLWNLIFLFGFSFIAYFLMALTQQISALLIIYFLVMLYVLIIILPNIAITVRRLRDAGLSNGAIITFMILIFGISLIGGFFFSNIAFWFLIILSIIQFALMVTPSNALVDKLGSLSRNSQK